MYKKSIYIAANHEFEKCLKDIDAPLSKDPSSNYEFGESNRNYVIPFPGRTMTDALISKLCDYESKMPHGKFDVEKCKKEIRKQLETLIDVLKDRYTFFQNILGDKSTPYKVLMHLPCLNSNYKAFTEALNAAWNTEKENTLEFVAASRNGGFPAEYWTKDSKLSFPENNTASISEPESEPEPEPESEPEPEPDRKMKDSFQPIKYSILPEFISGLFMVVLLAILYCRPVPFTFVPMEMDYETEKEDVLINVPLSNANHILPAGKTIKKGNKKPKPQASILFSEAGFNISISTDADKGADAVANANVCNGAGSCPAHVAGAGGSSDLLQFHKEAKKASPILYVRLIMLFLAYCLSGILCFIIGLKLIRRYSRREILNKQCSGFNNLRIITNDLKQEDRQSIEKQFAAESVRVFYKKDADE